MGEYPCKSVTSNVLKSHFFILILILKYSSVNMLHICRRTPFIENPSGKLLLYVVLNIKVINVEVLSKQVKHCLKYISIIKTLFLTLYVSFTWWPKIRFQMPIWLLKKHKRWGYMYVFGI